MAFYTYLWLREDGTPSYAGKGKERRAFRRGAPPLDRIILQYFESEQDALDAERFLIAFYGRKDLGTGCLRNLTDGGDGLLSPSPQVREKMRASHLGQVSWAKGKKMSEAHRQKLSEAHRGQICWLTGKHHSEETKRKISESKRGKSLPKEHYEKLSARFSGEGNPFYGKKHTPETVAKCALGRKGRPAWNKGLPCSEEMKRRLSAALKGKPRGARHRESAGKSIGCP